jgi:hypothetical protein
MVQQQAAVMSFLEVFRLLAVLFAIITPLVWLPCGPGYQTGGGMPAGE